MQAILIPPAYLRKMSRMRSSPTPSSVVDKHRIRVSHRDLHQTTDGFSSNNVIGSGSSGSVCKGFLDIEGERQVAIKVLKLQKEGASNPRASWRNARNRNLVKLLTYCSSLDYKNDKALILEFMGMRSLENWLHQPRGNLKLMWHLHWITKILVEVLFLYNSGQFHLHCN